ncbi:DNRLRE domain-containing protein [Nocardioides ginsengisoli]|uniref:DNRLRE domain-containing protein n=1 Tax=Nocardioides ginsengisoli TaxID=363868 RepID=A0ABW3W622_9ACTN
MSFSNGGTAPLAVAESPTDDASRQLEWNWPEELPKPELDGNTATYKDVVDGGDLVVIANPTGFTHNIVLREKPTDAAAFELTVTTPSAQLKETTGGDLAIVDAQGGELATAPAPVMWDATVDDRGEPTPVPLDFNVDTHAASSKTPDGLVLTPAEDFLNDPSTVYPVTIDPTFTLLAESHTWTTNQPGGGATGNVRLVAGHDGQYKWRSFLKFNGNSTWNGQGVISSNLILRNYYSTTCKAGAVRAYRITTPWNAPNLTWDHMPSATATNAVDYSPAHGASGCDNADATWNVTNIVRAWADGSTANYGFRIGAADETNANTYREYRGLDSSAGNVPRLVTTYNKKPQVTGVSFSPGTAATTSSKNPTITVANTDPDSTTLSMSLWINKSNFTRVWGIDLSVPANASKDVQVPAGLLADESTYSVNVTLNDGTSTGTFSRDFLVSLDKEPPNSPTVTSPNVGHDEFVDALPVGHAFQATSDETDASGFYVTRDDQPEEFIAAVNGAGSIPWSPASGPHTLAVAAVDAAGNRSDPDLFHFVVREFNQIDPAVLLFDVTLDPGESKSIPLPVVADIDWDQVDTITGTIAARDWQDGSTGSITVFDAQGNVTPEAGLTWDTSDSPGAGVSRVASTVVPSATNTIDLRNNSTTSIARVSLDLSGWWRLYAMDTDDAELTEGDETGDAETTGGADTYEPTECTPLDDGAGYVCATVSDASSQGAASYAAGSDGASAAAMKGAPCEYSKWGATRFELCAIRDVELVAISPVGVPMGEFKYAVGRRITVGHLSNKIKVRYTTNVWRATGYWSSLTVQAIWKSRCVAKQSAGSDYCSNLVVDSAVTLGSAWPNDWKTFDHEFVLNTPTDKWYDYAVDSNVYHRHNGQVLQQVTRGLRQSPYLRCDNMSYFNQSRGCIYPDYAPTFTLSKSDSSVREAASFYARVKNEFNWGSAAWPLHRTTVANRKKNYNKNCRNAKKRYGYVKSCDEFPFASTWEGCWTNGDHWKACEHADVDLPQNKLAGTRLGKFFNAQRLMRIPTKTSDLWDAGFKVVIAP